MPALNFETRGHIAYLTLNRPEVHNALNPEMLVQMSEAWQEVARNDARQPEDDWDRKLLANPAVPDAALLRGFEFYKPVISAINGFCIAGGMEFMQATDLRVAVDSASFGLQEVKWAILPGAGSLARLPRQMPYCKAMEILLTGNRIDAAEAYRLGLINYVVSREQLMPKAEELAATIAENGPFAVRKIKEAVIKCSGVPLAEAFKIENAISRQVMVTEDAREGPRAFMEKRKPRYQGK